MKGENKILLLTLLAAAAVWFTDSAVNYLFFSTSTETSLLTILIPNFPKHELFIRAKAIVHTDKGWVIFNASDGVMNQERISSATDTSVEVIINQKDNALSESLTLSLNRCQKNSSE